MEAKLRKPTGRERVSAQDPDPKPARTATHITGIWAGARLWDEKDCHALRTTHASRNERRIHETQLLCSAWYRTAFKKESRWWDQDLSDQIAQESEQKRIYTGK